jgi:NAD(P)-dependent dehydrogenase (short-subunit alcohol dehydrogenase family)
MTRVFALYPSLHGRVVLVTGGASGIGAEEVIQFARQGANVAFLDIDNDAAARLIEALRQEGLPPPLYLRCDL